MEYNVYCDESCHLENDKSDVMTIGAVYCPKGKSRQINDKIREIKIRNGIPPFRELKWIKVSPSKIKVYKELLDYFFENDDLHFRVIIIPDKSKLNHTRFNQSHDEWYYKMYFSMLKTIFIASNAYNVYLDIKDTNSYDKAKKLHTICCNEKRDFNKDMIKKMQPIRSEEVQIMQLTDLLIGAVTNYNRYKDNCIRSSAKQDLINLIIDRTGFKLSSSTSYRENKFNIFVWEAR